MIRVSFAAASDRHQEPGWSSSMSDSKKRNKEGRRKEGREKERIDGGKATQVQKMSG